MKDFSLWMTHLLPHWLNWISWIIWPLFLVANLIFIIYTFTLFANIISAPFNSLLSERVEALVKNKTNENSSWQDSLKSAPRALLREWEKIKYYLPRAILLLVLGFFPVINILSNLLWLVFGSWMMAIQYLDYPMDNHKISFNEMTQKLRTSYLGNFAFGASIMVLSFIPILNLFVMPAAVAGGTLKFLEEQNS
jgi:CysZ protein